jgi:hypothetical protein
VNCTGITAKADRNSKRLALRESMLEKSLPLFVRDGELIPIGFSLSGFRCYRFDAI